MKKFIAMMVALMMLAVTGMCFAESAAEVAEPEVVQIWDIFAMFKDDVQMEEGTYPSISFFLYNDGKVRAETDTQILEGTFEMTDDPAGYNFTFGDNTVNLVYDTQTGYLYLMDEISGTSGVFMIRPEDMPVEINAESIDEFQGTWRVNGVIRTGSLVHMDSEAGQEVLKFWNITDPIVTIEGTKVNVFGMLEGDAELVDGSLTVTTVNGVYYVTLTEVGSIIFDIPGENQYVSRMFADKE